MKDSKLDLTKLKTYCLKDRKSKVSIYDLAKTYSKGMSFSDFVGTLPGFLAAKDLREFVKLLLNSRQNQRPVILAMGAHPIKVGLSPLIIDLIERNIITAIATNGAALIHDFELAYQGHTSEDVEVELKDGSFGMAKDTAEFINRAITEGVAKGFGIGRSMGEKLSSSNFEHLNRSLFYCCYKKGIPATVHVAIGTDIIHMHPNANGSAIGEGSLRDFRLFTEVLADLQGGVFINLGSAVIMPEVFLKALTVVRNLGFTVTDFTTANFDFIQHYRPSVNVLRRPTQTGGRYFAFTGHHEIMFPLLYAMIVEGL